MQCHPSVPNILGRETFELLPTDFLCKTFSALLVTQAVHPGEPVGGGCLPGLRCQQTQQLRGHPARARACPASQPRQYSPGKPFRNGLCLFNTDYRPYESLLPSCSHTFFYQSLHKYLKAALQTENAKQAEEAGEKAGEKVEQGAGQGRWRCTVCTLENEPLSFYCDACNSPGPAKPKMVKYFLTPKRLDLPCNCVAAGGYNTRGEPVGPGGEVGRHPCHRPHHPGGRPQHAGRAGGAASLPAGRHSASSGAALVISVLC